MSLFTLFFQNSCSKFSARVIASSVCAATVFLLEACGSSAPLVEITAVTAVSPSFTKSTTFTVTGSNLPDSLTPTVTGCSSLSVLSTSSTTSRQFTCTPTDASVQIDINVNGAVPFSKIINIPDAPSVISVNAPSLSFGKLVTFTVSGTNLPTSINPTVSGCTGLTLAAGSSASSRQFSCTVDALTLNVQMSYGVAVPYAATLIVPAPQVTLVTSQGNVVVELAPDKAPITVKNFLSYVNNGFYAGTIFHRVIAGFVSQGGGFNATPTGGMTQKANSTAAITLESNNSLTNTKYSIAMARTNIADSATSQFFLNAANNTSLNYSPSVAAPNGYAVFGTAVAGTNVLDAINLVATGSVLVGTSTYTDVPKTAVTIISASQTR